MFLQIFILSIALVAIALLGLGVNIFFRKKAFPETSVGHNKALRNQKIYCIKTEQVIIDKKYNQKYKTPDCTGC
jgi:hypothetical protein